MSEIAHLDEIKRKIRRLKRTEAAIRFGGKDAAEARYVWDRFFDLHAPPSGNAKYTLGALAALSREEYGSVIDEYFALVYYEFYRENGILPARIYNPDALSSLGLPFNADQNDVRSKFRELAKKHHPDVGGDTDEFIKIMDAYKKLSGR